MTELTYIPQGDLAPFVKFLWYSDNYNPLHNKERVLPGGSSQIIINLGNNHFRHFKSDNPSQGIEYTHSILTGLRSRHIFLDSSTRNSTMGAGLKPGAIQALFGIPGSKFQDHVIAIGDIINCDIDSIQQQLIYAPNPYSKFTLLESFLTNLLNKSFQLNHGIIYAAKKIENQSEHHSVSDIADNIGYSNRWLSELFRNMIGVTPKEFARIQRFQKSLRMIRQVSEPDWSQLALSCGYYDQPHFNREFKALSGLTPTQYFENQTRETNHLPA